MPLSFNLEPSAAERVIFLFMIATSLGLFSFFLNQRIRLVFLGGAENRFDNIKERIKVFFLNVFAHRLVLKDFIPGFMHFIFFWAFLTLTLGYLNLIVGALSGGFYPLGEGSFFDYYSFARDSLAVLAVIGVFFAFFRRYVLKPPGLENTPSAITVLTLVFLVVSAGIIYDSFRLVLISDMGGGFFPNLITGPLAGFFAGFNFTEYTYFIFYKAFWWIHFLIIFGFLVYIPLSKHLHLLACPFNEFFINLSPKGAVKFLDVENSITYGASKINEFTWKGLLDLLACAECGRCHRKCPATLSEKALSPEKIIKKLKEHLLNEGPGLLKDKEKKSSCVIQNIIHAPEDHVCSAKINGGSASGGKGVDEWSSGAGFQRSFITEEEIWDCTTCRACQEICPVLIEHMDKIIQMRRNLVLTESRFPKEVVLFFKNLENNFNPWGIGSSTRADWAKDLNVRVLDEQNKSCEVLYWAGCAGSFDERNKKVSRSLVKVLKHAGVDFAVLGAQEACCGEAARRIGNEYLFQMLAQQNMEVFKSFNVKKIITGCPHCFNTFKNEYSQLGNAGMEAVHSSVFIADLIKQKKLKFSKELNLTLTYHDSCYLGRYNSIYSPPRQILESLPGVKLVEMKSIKENGFCCGAGGGRMWMEDTGGKKIYHLRTEEVIKSKSGHVCSACPYCTTMLEDGLKEREREDIKVLDLTEIAAMALNE